MYTAMYTYSFRVEYTELDLYNLPSGSIYSIDVD